MFSFPRPDKKRPVLVLTRSDMIGRLNTVTVAPITSTVRSAPSEVVVGPECGLKQPSAINLHHLATVPGAGLRSFVGTVSPQVMSDVRSALLFALGFADPTELHARGRAAPSPAEPR
jgi:mRNA interferase MazF